MKYVDDSIRSPNAMPVFGESHLTTVQDNRIMTFVYL